MTKHLTKSRQILRICRVFGGGRAYNRATGREARLALLNYQAGSSACETLICHHDSETDKLELLKLKKGDPYYGFDV